MNAEATMQIFNNAIESKRLRLQLNQMRSGTLIWPNKQLLFFLAVCLMFLCLACKKDTDQAPGSLSFNYNGMVNGHFSAVGDLPEPPPSNGIIYHEHTSAERIDHFTNAFDPSSSEPWISITANFPTSQSLPVSNFIMFLFPQMGVGTFPLFNDWRGTQLLLDENLYSFVDGSVSVTGYDKGRVKGTFQGNARAGGDPAKQVRITDGQFDIKIK